MRGSTRDRRPYVRPVQKLEVSEKNTRLRFILMIVFLVIGAAALGIFVSQLLGKDSGWREIETDVPGISEEIIFNYDLGSGGMGASAEYRLIEALYSETASKLYQLFDRYAEYDGINNLYTINQHPNEVLVVDEMLYDALKMMTEQGGRYLYLAPVYAEYNGIFTCENDMHAARRDPNKDENTLAYFSEITRMLNDPEMIELELLGDGKICLHVAETYLEWARINAIDCLIDFAWLKNAFIVDSIAQVMIDAGYTLGNVTSFDGFGRNLDPTGRIYSYNVFDRFGNGIYSAATFKYEKPTAIVFMRNYPMSTELDRYRYYSYADGDIATGYLDPADGCYRSALHNVTSYSTERGCAEIALALAPIYIAQAFDAQALNALVEQDIYSLWGMDGVLYYNEQYVSLDSLYSDAAVTYRKEYAGK